MSALGNADKSTATDDLGPQFHALYTSGIIGILHADAELILAANDAFLALVGYTREEMEAGALRWAAMTPPEYAALDERAVHELETMGRCTPFEKEYICKDGTRVPIQIAAAVVQRDPLQWVCYVIDMSASRRAGAWERTLGTIIEHVPVGVIVIDHSGRLLLMNRTGRRISGEAPDASTAVADQSYTYALREPHTGRRLEPDETPIARALAGETVTNYEYVFQPRGSLQDRWVRTVSVPLIDERDQVIGAVAVFEDVTDERLREQAREDFLATAAHDLRTPLTSIKGFAQLLERRLARDGTLQRDIVESYLQRTVATANRMEDLLLELLDDARLQAGERLDLVMQRVDLVDLVRRVVEQCAEISAVHPITVESPRSALVGMWDVRRLQRAIENLIVNAIRYSPDGGEVSVRVTEVKEGGHLWAVVQVSDIGLGIPAQDLPRIFERFYRGSNVAERVGGTGIGLASVKQIVEQHGGRISVESREGAGSTFSLHLPSAPEERHAR